MKTIEMARNYAIPLEFQHFSPIIRENEVFLYENQWKSLKIGWNQLNSCNCTIFLFSLQFLVFLTDFQPQRQSLSIAYGVGDYGNECVTSGQLEVGGEHAEHVRVAELEACKW